MKHVSLKRCSRGMTLAEVMGAVIISSMVLAAVLSLYSRLFDSAQDVMNRLETSQLPQEILQLIAEDLDKLVAIGPDTRVTLSPQRFEGGYELQRLEIRRTYLDAEEKEQLLESIVWQTAVDYGQQKLMLYRAHQGEVFEDRLLDQVRVEDTSQYPYIPVCAGLSFFDIQVPQGENLLDIWQNEKLPPGLRFTLSFAEPDVSPQGVKTVPEESLVTRTIALDRTREIRFEMPASEDANDVNAPAGMNGMSETNQSKEPPANAARPSRPSSSRR